MTAENVIYWILIDFSEAQWSFASRTSLVDVELWIWPFRVLQHEPGWRKKPGMKAICEILNGGGQSFTRHNRLALARKNKAFWQVL